MVLIFISWIYLFFTSVTLGIALAKFVKIKSADLVITSFLGLFLTTLLASTWSFFDGIDGTFHIVLLLFNIAFFIRNVQSFKQIIVEFRQDFSAFTGITKILFCLLFALMLAQCAGAPFIIDNESYYIQSIKWLNEYGLVKGLANLHLFFGQMSGWHITQSVFNFSFVYDRFNDLNGYALMLLNFFAFKKLSTYFKKGNKMDLLFGLLPLCNVFFFAFISAPSPDLPIYILSFLIFALYIDTKSKPEAFAILMLLALFAIFIKVTAIVLLVFPTIVLIRNFPEVKKNILTVGALALFTLALFIAKNVMLTGYPLFPLAFLRCDRFDYTLPAVIRNYFFSAPMMHSFYMPFSAFENASLSDCFKHYFLHNGLGSIIGGLSIIMALISPLVISKMKAKKTIKTIYGVFLLLLVLLCLSSPQYRFYVHFTIFFGLLLLSVILKNKKVILTLLGLSLFSIAVLLFIPVSFIGLTQNKSLSANTTFQIDNIVFPKPNSQFNQTFIQATKSTLIYNTPTEYPYFWITGNGGLPCVTTEQLQYFETHFGYIPQMRDATMKNGFYAKKILAHD
jgi:hypothetical protein